MRWLKIEAACREACRFLEIANRLQECEDRKAKLFGSVLSGQLRRSSMDLSRVLSEMRKP